jgi:hypothetical protein
MRTFVNTVWWDEKTQSFYTRLNTNHVLEGRAGSSLLYRDIADDGPKMQSALNDLLENIKKRPSSSVEGQSHHAEILYRYGVTEVACEQMMDLTRPDRDRREYPEVSYSVIGAIVTGTMGITVDPVPPLRATVEGSYVDRTVRTLPGLGSIAWVEIHNLPIRANEVAVRHDGGRKTTFTNQRGPALIWQATFSGSSDTLLVRGRPVKARVEKGPLGRVTSSVRVAVGAGETVRAGVPD